jgi:hypothetical protein
LERKPHADCGKKFPGWSNNYQENQLPLFLNHVEQHKNPWLKESQKESFGRSGMWFVKVYNLAKSDEND